MTLRAALVGVLVVLTVACSDAEQAVEPEWIVAEEAVASNEVEIIDPGGDNDAPPDPVDRSDRDRDRELDVREQDDVELPSPDPFDPTDWDVDADYDAIRERLADIRNAFVAGAEQGFTAQADATWPQHTAMSLLTCDYFGDPPGFEVLDAEEYVQEYQWSNLTPRPGWELPVFGSPAQDGYRVYLGDLIISWGRTVDGVRENDSITTSAHVGIDDRGHVVMFPACDDYLP